MHSLVLGTIFMFFFPQSSFGYYVFQSRDSTVRPVIEKCRAITPNEKIQCYEILRCILDDIFSDYPARWSAGASVLAFVPTIVGLMSNSINEITAIAEESTFLATAICLSSITVFSARFSARFGYQDGRPEHLHTMKNNIHRSIKNNKQMQAPRWRNTQTQNVFVGIFMLGTSAMTWYELFQVTKYGIVTFACPVKVNVMLWAILGQILTLLNVFLRQHLFAYRKIHLKKSNDRFRQNLAESSITIEKDVVIIFRSPHSSWTSQILQFFTAVINYSLYAFGTVVLASMTMFPASDAVRVMVVVCANAGFGRVVGYWAGSRFKSGKETILIDVLAGHLEELSDSEILRTLIQ